jgi:hypothetical protein
MKTLSVVLAMAALTAAAASARATVFTGSFDVIYSDTFAGPAVNVNAAGSDPSAIVGNAPAVATGLDGGSASATYLGLLSTSTTAAPDTNWDYSGSNAAKITSPTANINTTGNIGEDGKTITNLTLPLVPVLGFSYDFSLTAKVPSATGGHGLEMAFLYNNGNGHNTAAQAISNNDPAGLILDRDALVNTTTTNNFVDIFEGTGTNSDNAVSQTFTGPLASTVTYDVVFTPTSATAGTFSWYVNGTLFNSSPVAITGLTAGITNIQFGDNQTTGGTFTNFSLTAQSPEPASLGLLAVGAMGLIARRRR